MAIEQLVCFLKTHPHSMFVGQALFESEAQKLTSWTQLWGNAWPRSRRKARSRYARGSLHHSQAPVSAMRFIYGPNKPEQNILCGRLQSVLLWLEMKLKNVSQALQRNTFVTFFIPQESNIVVRVVHWWQQLQKTGWNKATLCKLVGFSCASPYLQVDW